MRMNSHLLSIAYPVISPIAIQFLSFQVTWYGLSYVMGILSGWMGARIANKTIQFSGAISDLVSNVMIGIIIGGRLGYVMLYNPSHYWHHPLEIVALWNGGMSFHGGALGAAIGCWIYCKQHRHSIVSALDILAIAVPPGLCFGRIANFINGELFGRPSTLPWAMVFPNGGTMTRHPSQLYEAMLEGIFLGILLWIFLRYMYVKGHLFTLFLIGYGTCRFFVEFTRSPDAHIGRLIFQLSMGQLLSILMIVLGGLWGYAIHKQLLR